MKKHFLFFAFLSCALSTILAQKTITGTVSNDKNEPLVGANIVLQGTTIGAISDIEGKYQLNIPSKLYSDTLICSFVGHESKMLSVNLLTKLDFKLSVGVKMQEFTVVGYYMTLRHCTGCSCMHQIIYEDWKNPLTPTPLSNGHTRLTYEVNISSKGVNHHLNNRFEDKKVQYEIFKSTDGENFKLIGTSRSDTNRFFKQAFNTLELTFGGSQFLDRTINTADTTYYKVEGYLINVDDEDEIEENIDKEPKEREYVFRQTTTVLPNDVLKITNLYVAQHSNQIQLSLSSPQQAQADFIVSDMSGRVVLRHKQEVFKNNNTLILSFDDMPSGMYVLSAMQGVQVDSRKFVVVN